MPAVVKRMRKDRSERMINYRVDDLESFVKRLKKNKIRVDSIHVGPYAEGMVKFTRLKDSEGNRIEK